MRHAVKEGLVGFVDSTAEGEEEVRLRDAWSLDDQDRVRAAGPPHTAPRGSYCNRGAVHVHHSENPAP